MRRRKLRNTRPKALFGEVAAAGITAAATLAAAGIGAAATAKAAKEQSAATIENAKQQAASIEQTNINNNQLQQQSQQFIAQENEANRQIQRDLQMNLQLQSGALDSEQRRMASRIQVKEGGKVKSRKKLRDAQFPLRGSILGAQFTDGADTPDGEFLGYTPEGYPAVKAKGDKHSEYHKDGKRWRSGIGFKIPGQPEIEVENNEVIVKRPDDYVIFSNTSRHGQKPSKLIEEGMPADYVLNFQEMTNREQGNSPVRRNRYAALAGVSTNYILPTDYPINDLGFDMSGINVATARRQLKKGGRCKAVNGTILGGYITGGANLLSGALAGVGSWYSNKYAADAAPIARNYLIQGYKNMKTINPNIINRNMFRSAGYMPILTSVTPHYNSQIEQVNRTKNSAINAVKRNTLSSAAVLSRIMGINDIADQQKSKIYESADNLSNQYKIENMKASNEAAAKNAELAMQGNLDYTRSALDIAKYNTDIENTKVSGIAQANADAAMDIANYRGAGLQGLLGNIGVGIQGFGTNVGKAYARDYKQNLERDQVLFGMPLENQVEWTARRGSLSDKASLINSLEISKENATDENQIKQIDMWIAKLRGKQSLRNTPSDWEKLQDYISGMKDALRS